MNWKSRLKNKATLIALIGAAVALVYQVLGWFYIVMPVSSDEIINAAGIAVNILVMLGIVVDPNTPGITDGEKESEVK